MISWSEILGGVMGFALLAVTATQQRNGITTSLGPMPTAWFVTSTIAFSVAILAGVGLLRQHRHGLVLSSAVQLAQIVKVTVPGIVTYQFSSGVNLLVTISPTGIGVGPGFAANLAVLPLSIAPYWIVSVDLLAATAALMLLTTSADAFEQDKVAGHVEILDKGPDTSDRIAP